VKIRNVPALRSVGLRHFMFEAPLYWLCFV
jgi:hypothetical protein